MTVGMDRGRGRGRRRLAAGAGVAAGVAALSASLAGVGQAAGGASGTLQNFTASRVASVVAPSGDNNPYGLAVVPLSMGKLVAGDLLVADFNDKAGTAGGGTSLLQVSPTTGAVSVFATGLPISGPVGLAINPVNDGVWVGDFGTGDGSKSNDLLIAPNGIVKADFNATTVNAKTGYSGPKPTFDGVWGQGVSKVPGQVSFYYGTTGSGANGTGGGEIWRIDPHPTGAANGQPVNSTYAKVASGLGDNATTKALPVTAANAAGPQALAYDAANGSLYVSNDADNTITIVPGAAHAASPVSTRTLPVPAGVLNTPENLALDPSTGTLLVVNAGNNTLVALNPSTGAVEGTRVLDNGQPGALFGLAVTTDASGHPKIYYVDDNTNTLNALTYAAPATGGTVSPSAPRAVQAGSGGQAASGSVPFTLIGLLGAGGLAAATVGARRLARR